MRFVFDDSFCEFQKLGSDLNAVAVGSCGIDLESDLFVFHYKIDDTAIFEKSRYFAYDKYARIFQCLKKFDRYLRFFILTETDKQYLEFL